MHYRKQQCLMLKHLTGTFNRVVFYDCFQVFDTGLISTIVFFGRRNSIEKGNTNESKGA